MGGEVRVDVSDAAPADRWNETRGEDDDRQGLHKLTRLTRVVMNDVTNDARDDPWPSNRETQQFTAAAGNRRHLHPGKPARRHRVQGAAAARPKGE